ncbi:hypothetical protein E0E52_17295 [Azotobacter chroococcum]|nr:hypothetical protein E0E52_17295 [Azotobacter chroococcum]
MTISGTHAGRRAVAPRFIVVGASGLPALHVGRDVRRVWRRSRMDEIGNHSDISNKKAHPGRVALTGPATAG